MRKSTAAWLSLAALCGALLFHTSQMTTDGASRLAGLESATGREKESIRVLSAEWGYLNAPDRLEKLSRAHLDLEPMKGKQFASAEALEERTAVTENTLPQSTHAFAGADHSDGEESSKKSSEVRILKTETPEAKPALPAPRKEAAAKKAPAPKTAEKGPPVFPRYVPPGYGTRKAQPSYPPKAQPSYSPKAQPSYPQKAPPPARPPEQQQRGFGDLMKSLGAG